MKFVAVDDEMESIKDDWIDSDKEDVNQKYKKLNVIYFKKGSGEVVIYLKDITDQDDRRAIAKHQFENILKCGLIGGNKFNNAIFENDFAEGNWEMPGISARVSNGPEFNVVCSLKRRKGIKISACHFIKSNQWNNLGEVACIRSFEHTERQLMYSMLYGCTKLTGSSIPNLYSEPSEFVLEKENDVTLTPPIKGELFLIWTRGNPCITIDDLVDNGGYCCAVWYKEMMNVLLRDKGAKMYLFYGEKSGAHKDIQVRLCGTVAKKAMYPTAENFNTIRDLVDIFFADYNCRDDDCRDLLRRFETSASHNGIGVVYTVDGNSVIFSKSVMDANLLCCLIAGQKSLCFINSLANPIAILNTWTGDDSSIEYQTW